MNWAGFGGFARGFSDGIQIGKTIGDAFKQDKLNKVREQGIAEANAARQAAIESSVRDTQAQEQVADAAKAAKAAEQPAPQAGQIAPDTATVQTAAVAPPPQTVMPAAAGFARPAGPPADVPMEAPPAPVQAAAPAPAPQVAPAAQGLPTPPKRFMVGDRGFDTRDEALAHAEKVSPSQMDFYVKQAVPRIAQAYMEQGDVEKAEAWDKYAREKTTQRNMDTWSKMARAAQSGNFERAADHAFELYRSYDDGVTPVSKEIVKDNSGTVTGFNVKLKDDATGETRSQFIGTKEIVEMGLSALSPPAMFEQMYKRQSQADALGAKARIDAQNDARTFQREIYKQDRAADREDARDVRRSQREAVNAERAHGYKLEELATAEDLKVANMGKQKKAEVQAKIDILKDSGLSPDAIREVIPHMLGGDGYKKSTSPEEARRMLLTEHAKDPLFNNKSEDQKRAIIDQEMGVIYGKPSTTPATKAPATPGPGDAKPKGTPYLTPGGTIEYR